jgi:hypothetical protein
MIGQYVVARDLKAHHTEPSRGASVKEVSALSCNAVIPWLAAVSPAHHSLVTSQVKSCPAEHINGTLFWRAQLDLVSCFWYLARQHGR